MHQKIEFLAKNSTYYILFQAEIRSQCLVQAQEHTERYSIELRIMRDGLGSEQVKKQKNI
jgi:hypothetical protein